MLFVCWHCGAGPFAVEAPQLPPAPCVVCVECGAPLMWDGIAVMPAPLEMQTAEARERMRATAAEPPPGG